MGNLPVLKPREVFALVPKLLLSLLYTSVRDPSFRQGCRNPCAREGAQSVRWKSAPEEAIISEAEGNCLAARRGGEQQEANRQSVV